MQIRLEHIQELEKTAAKGGAIMVEAAYLIELREAIEWARRAYTVIVCVNDMGIIKKPQFDTWDVEQAAPAMVKE